MKSSIVICTYNEEKTIANVVMAACKFNPENEVIVVDDGSTDNTEKILIELTHQYSFRYERLDQNMGKSWAMVHGVEKSENEIILFFDADVSNIKKEHFDALLTPILKNEADMVLGQPSETLIDYKINPFKPLSGQRALRKREIVSILNDIRDIRFGIETYLNLYYQAQGKRIKYILLKGLKHPTKYEKTTPVKATKEFIIEGHEIAATLVKNHNLITQKMVLQFNNTQANATIKFKEIQNELDIKIQDFKNKIEKISQE
jgi:glycosyltransferase involved in cell wall biosynthesis